MSSRHSGSSERERGAMSEAEIVIADTDQTAARLVADQLEQAGYMATTCEDGLTALESLWQRSPAILVAEWDLPALTGSELCRRIRCFERDERVHVILRTSGDDPERVTAAFAAGADDYLTKSAPVSELLARVRAGERILRLLARRREAEQKAREAYARTEQHLSSISSVLIGVDENDRIIRWNQAAEAAFGRATADVLGLPFRQCGVHWDWSVLDRCVAECRKTNQAIHPEEIPFQRADGSEGFLGMTVNPIRWDSVEPSGFLIVAADITQRRALQSQLAQAQRLESIGQLAAGIAHEINTPTQFVGDNTRFVRDAFVDLKDLLLAYGRLHEAASAGAVTKELLEEIDSARSKADLGYLLAEIPAAISQSLEGIERVTRIVRAMKDFSHPGGAEKSAVDLNKAIESTITVARNEWKYVAEVVTDFDPTLPPVPCLVGDFNQVILNLIVNAAHAIAGVVGDGSAGKGTIQISTHHGDGWAEVRIGDTGTGIPEEIRGKVFDPFFTTKEVGKGTGQGLAIAHAVVTEKHGGTITFESEVGQGTTFIIRLPCETEASDSAGAPEHEEAHSVC